jgi:hypothetical protein
MHPAFNVCAYVRALLWVISIELKNTKRAHLIEDDCLWPGRKDNPQATAVNVGPVLLTTRQVSCLLRQERLSASGKGPREATRALAQQLIL